MFGMERLADLSSSGHRKAISEMRAALETLSKVNWISQSLNSVGVNDQISEFYLNLTSNSKEISICIR